MVQSDLVISFKIHCDLDLPEKTLTRRAAVVRLFRAWRLGRGVVCLEERSFGFKQRLSDATNLLVNMNAHFFVA